MEKQNPAEVHCPNCGSYVGKYDGKSSMNLVTRCKKCRKQIVYNIKTRETSIRPLPARITSSGMTF